MKCPSEYTCSVFADGELPEAAARQVALHLEVCESCDRLVAALRGESRLLVQSLQEIGFEEVGEVPGLSPAAPPVPVVRFVFWIIGAALLFRLSTAILLGLNIPAELEWLDPREWSLNGLSVALNAATYAIQDAPFAVAGIVNGAVLVALAAGALLGMKRVLKRSAAIGTICAVMLLIFVSSPSSYAVDLRKGAQASIPASETVDDSMFLRADGAYQNIDVAGTIKGDLLAIGDVLTIRGNVEGNVVALARRVEVSGTVGGSILGAGSAIVVSGQVGRNFLGFSGNINVNKDAKVGGNAVLFSGDTILEGPIQRDVLSLSGILDVRDGIGRNLFFRGGQLHLAAPARVGGNLRAHVDKEEQIRIDSGAVIGGTKTIELSSRNARPSRYFTVRYYVWQAVRLLAAFVTGLILFWLFPWLAPVTVASGKDWLKAGGLGFVALVTIPIAVIIIGITIIGLPIALMSLMLWMAGIYLSTIIVAEFIGRSMMQNTGAVALLAGLLIIIVAVNLPWIGGLINFLLCLLGLGAIVMTVYRTYGLRQQNLPVMP
jgi:anti-sigma factor RsiW